MLGLCALHLLARALSEYYNLNGWSATICCNNKRTLILSSHHRGQIQPSAKGADIQRSFCATKQTYQGGFKYTHLYGHMDHHSSWLQLSLTQQLNCLRYLSKTSSNKCHYERLPQQSDSDPSKRRCCTHCLGRQNNGRRLQLTPLSRE
jgi:hypothetical protein